VESNIHEPSDSSLLWDCVRVLSRLMAAARDEFAVPFVNHKRRARRRSLGILNAKRAEQRVPLYRDLLRVTEMTIVDAQKVAAALDDVRTGDLMQRLRAQGIAAEIRHYVPLTERVVNQTVRRVLQGEAVPSSEKLVSIFEAHTDIIVKDRRETLYGHKVCLTSGASGIVVDVVVESGNPADSTLAVKMVARARNVIGKVARQFAFDGGFSSKQNVAKIKTLGTKDVAFTKHKGMKIEDMVRSKWVFKKLRNFRAGIEGVISLLKRGFGLSRCTWKGLPAFRSYVWGSVVAFNLLTLARHLLPPPA
jgi:IS5 family transposase